MEVHLSDPGLRDSLQEFWTIESARSENLARGSLVLIVFGVVDMTGRPTDELRWGTGLSA